MLLDVVVNLSVCLPTMHGKTFTILHHQHLFLLGRYADALWILTWLDLWETSLVVHRTTYLLSHGPAILFLLLEEGLLLGCYHEVQHCFQLYCSIACRQIFYAASKCEFIFFKLPDFDVSKIRQKSVWWCRTLRLWCMANVSKRHKSTFGVEREKLLCILDIFGRSAVFQCNVLHRDLSFFYVMKFETENCWVWPQFSSFQDRRICMCARKQFSSFQGRRIGMYARNRGWWFIPRDCTCVHHLWLWLVSLNLCLHNHVLIMLSRNILVELRSILPLQISSTGV